MKFWLIVGSIFTMAFLAMVSSCDNEKDEKNDSFDRAEMLRNYAENVIIPAYKDLQGSIGKLNDAAQNFIAEPGTERLDSLQTSWVRVYQDWQYTNAFNFGPAGEEGLKKGLIEEVGTFPVSESKINDAINTGTYNLNDFNRDARGLLAIEFLIFSLEDNDQLVIESFDSQNRKTYLVDLIANLQLRVDDVLNEWHNSYKEEFISNAGTDVGSSTSQFYNEFVKNFEAIKNYKVGLPLGRIAGQTQTEPEMVEAYYSGMSLTMIDNDLRSIENLWYGRNKDGIDGIGFEEYLNSVEGGPALISSTKQQLEVIKNALALVPDDQRLSDLIESEAPALVTLHTELQKHIRYFKSDMSSLLGISITYSSGDGD